MFERFSQDARRAIFFARHEANQGGSDAIESEHLLLGAVRADKERLREKLGLAVDEAELSAAVEAAAVQRGDHPMGIYPQFSGECKRALEFARDEAGTRGGERIGVEHIVLGILREESCVAAGLLRGLGLSLEKARAVLSVPLEGAGKAGVGAGTGTGSGRGASPDGMGAPSIQVIDAGTLETLLVCRSLTPFFPRAGESILIHDAAGAPHPYTVRNVVWEFGRGADPAADSEQLREVKVLVVKEREL